MCVYKLKHPLVICRYGQKRYFDLIHSRGHCLERACMLFIWYYTAAIGQSHLYQFHNVRCNLSGIDNTTWDQWATWATVSISLSVSMSIHYAYSIEMRGQGMFTTTNLLWRQRHHNRAWQPHCKNFLTETSGTLWICGLSFVIQQCLLISDAYWLLSGAWLNTITETLHIYLKIIRSGLRYWHFASIAG